MPGEGLGHQGRDEGADVAPVGRHLLDHAGGHEGPCRACGDEDRIGPRCQGCVDVGHLKLVAHVGRRAQSLDDHVRGALFRKVHQQALEAVDLDARQVPQDSLEELHPLLDLEQRLLLGIPEHGHNHPVEVPGGPLDDVDMAVGGRVEGAGAEGKGHEGSPSRSGSRASCSGPGCRRKTRVVSP